MSELGPLSSNTRWIPSIYHGKELGRDDPVWPSYVKEAEKWDNDLVESWNKGMDVTILFAALFLAIVTAFLIEIYKNLKEDSTELMVAGISEANRLLCAIAMGQVLDLQDSTNSSLVFQPSKANVVVNTLWFFSLSLSLSVTLMAMLVKRWGNTYRSGHILTPPHIQAQIRQSRLDKLDGAKWIALALPAVVHIALGTFLIGLVIFLWQINCTVAVPVIVVFSLTSLAYLLATFYPLLAAFTPYSTPFSYAKWKPKIGVALQKTKDSIKEIMFELLNETQPKQAEESDENPDEVTGRALHWLVKHSQDDAVVDIAIRAIASAKLTENVWHLLAEDLLIVLLAQKFTAFFNRDLDRETKLSSPLSKESTALASMYGRALTMITRHRVPVDEEFHTQSSPDSTQYTTRGVPLTYQQVRAVTRGLHRLAEDKGLSDVAAFGIASVSSWYTYTRQPRTCWKSTLRDSFRIVLERIGSIDTICSDALASLLRSLPIEISHWESGLSNLDKQNLVVPLIELLAKDKWPEQFEEDIPIMLAVLAISCNDYPDVSTTKEAKQWELQYPQYAKLVATHLEAAEAWNRGPDRVSEDLTPCDSTNNAGWRAWRAQQAARIYTMYPQLRKDCTENLLLVGLVGLLDSLGTLGLEEKSTDAALAIASRLAKISLLNKSRPVTLPFVFPVSFDIRRYAVDRVVHVLRPSCYIRHVGSFTDSARAKLLAVFSEKHRIWIDFGAQIALPIIELLDDTLSTQQLYEPKSRELLLKQCLMSMEEHLLTSPSQLFFQYTMSSRLIAIIKSNALDLCGRAISNFESFSRSLECSDNPRLKFDLLKSLLQNDLFETFVAKVVFRRGARHMDLWKQAILDLPQGADIQCLNLLDQICHSSSFELLGSDFLGEFKRVLLRYQSGAPMRASTL